MTYKKKTAPAMEDYNKVQYYGMPVYNKNNKKRIWSQTSAQSASLPKKKYPWPAADGNTYYLGQWKGLYQMFQEEKKEPWITLPHGISDFMFSPDENWIFLTSYDEAYSTDFTEPVAYETHPFKSDADLGFKVRRNSTLWLLKKDTQRLICLLDGATSFSHPLWTPNSSAIVYQGTTKEGLLCFYKISVTETNPTPQLLAITSNVSPCLDNKSGMQFTPNGDRLIFAANPPEDEYADPPALYQISFKETVSSYGASSTELQKKSKGSNGEGVAFASLTQVAVPLIHPDYNKNGIFTSGFPFLYREEKIQTFVVPTEDRCVYIAPKEGSLCVFEVSITEKGMEIPRQITKGPDNFHTLTCVNKKNVLALHTDPTHLPEIVELTLESGSYEQLTEGNQWTEERSLTPAISHWIGEAGTSSHTQGFYLPPANVEPEKKYPAILYCHGGPTGFYISSLDLEFQTLAANGFAVMYVNPRGSTGYGAIHSQDEDAYNGNAAADLESFVQEMCRLYPYIDPSRLGVCGGSYGGYMTAYLASHNHLFRAASSHRPLLNWQMIGYASHSAGCMHTRKAFPHFPDYIKECLDISPTTYGQQIKIPFQIQQSLRDANCIPEQVFQLFATIRNFNPEVPCRMVLYPDSGHSLLSKGPLSLAIQHRKDNMDWMKEHL